MTVYGDKRISISQRRTGGRYEKRRSELINQIYFSNYKKMETWNYPEDYLKKRGNIMHCWRVHKAKMQELGLPYVQYRTFYDRLNRQHWDLYKAIHTQAHKYTKKTWWRKFISLFKK